METPSTPEPSRPPERPKSRRIMVPDILCFSRLIGSLGLVALALAQQPYVFVGLFLILTLTDWLDGKLAIWLDQGSDFGARLDSIADGAMYAALLFGGIWLRWEFLLREWPWIAAALASYLLTVSTALIKFRRLPSYHTRMAKISWLLVAVAVVFVFAEGWPWALRIATAAVAVTNLETTAITLISSEWQANVPSIFHAARWTHKRTSSD